MVIIAKYAGTCKRCGAYFSRGATIEWARGTGVTGCPSCRNHNNNTNHNTVKPCTDGAIFIVQGKDGKYYYSCRDCGECPYDDELIAEGGWYEDRPICVHGKPAPAPKGPDPKVKEIALGAFEAAGLTGTENAVTEMAEHIESMNGNRSIAEVPSWEQLQQQEAEQLKQEDWGNYLYFYHLDKFPNNAEAQARALWYVLKVLNINFLPDDLWHDAREIVRVISEVKEGR